MMNRGFIALALVAAVSAAGCRATTAASASATPADPARIAVQVTTARHRSMIRTAQAQGALFPREKSQLASEVPGSVQQIFVDLGDQVKQGQELMRIDPREYALRVDSAQAQFEQEQAKLTNARASYERMAKLAEARLVSQSDFDQSSAAMRVAQADTDAANKQLGIARKKLSDVSIRAPFAGFVQRRMVSPGEHVAEGTPVFELIAIDPIKLRAMIPERFVPMATVGLNLDLSVDARPGTTYHGRVTRIAPALEETSRTLMIEAEVPNHDGTLRPGYFAHVTLNLGRDSALFVPQNAILRYAGVARVFVVKDGEVHSREVATGQLEGDSIEIVSGLADGEKVVTTEVDRLADGTPVIAQEQS